MMSELADNIIHRVNVGDSLTRTAARHPRRTAIVDGDLELDYSQFNAWVNRVAHGLSSRGYSRGDALALASGNSAEFLVTYYACAKLGVVCVPVNLGWRAPEVAHVLNHSGARGIVVETQLVGAMGPALADAPRVKDVVIAKGTATSAAAGFDAALDGATVVSFDQLAADREDEPSVIVGDRDPITYLYTSGTTSVPKGVVGNHTAIYLESMSLALEAKFDETDVFIAMMPMFHTAQLNCHCTAAVMVGAAIHVHRGFDADRLLAEIPARGVTQLFGLPMMYRQLLDHPKIASTDLSSLRRALYAMAPMPEAQLKRCLEVFDCDFYLLFGQTEMSPTATLFRPEHQLTHNGAAGTPVANVQVAIMSDSGALLPQGEVGEIVYRGPHTMSGYLNDTLATETAFAHGWFHSGDVGRFDEDGILWFQDRKKDVIKSGGENVASIEVEKAIYAADPAVGEVVVIGLPHEHWTEAITAVVTPAPGQSLDPDRLIAKVKQLIDPYKAPKSVIVLEELPRTSTGKVQKNLLRQQYEDHYDRSL
jgi:acyl-CoA synthetase (AMP-forming)/AMP-acid ligase II